MHSNETMRLLVTPRPQLQESLLGYLLRVTEANGYPKLQWLPRLAGLHHVDPFKPPGDGKLETILNLPAGTLEHLFYAELPGKQSGSRVRFGTSNVRRSAVGVKRSRVCPHCLADSGFALMAWDLSLITVCPRHGSRLIDECPNCARPLTWSREKLLVCPCGCDLRTASAPRASDPARSLSAALLEKAGLDSGFQPAVRMPAEFEHFGLAEAVDLVTFLGPWAVGRGIGTGRRLTGHLSASARHTLFDAAAMTLAEWPESFSAIIDNVRTNSGNKVTRTGLLAEFGSFVQTLYRPDFLIFENTPGLASAGEFVRSAFENYIERHWDGGFIRRGNTRLTRGNELDPQFLPLAEAARRLGMHPSVVRRFVDTGHLHAISRPMNRRRLILIGRDSLDSFRFISVELLDLQGALDIVGISKVPFLDLVNAGHIRAFRGPKVDGSHIWQFRKRDIEHFLAAIFACAGTNVPADAGIPFMDAVRKATWHGLKAADIVTEVLTGQLPVLSRDTADRGLAQCRFSEDCLNAMITRRRTPRAESVTIPEAAKRLGLNGEAAYDLVQRNLLRTVSAVTMGKAHLAVPADAIAEFQSTYVAAAEIANELGSSARHVVTMLEDLRITPITGPKVDQGRQYFFRRGQVDDSVRTLLAASAARSAPAIRAAALPLEGITASTAPA